MKTMSPRILVSAVAAVLAAPLPLLAQEPPEPPPQARQAEQRAREREARVAAQGAERAAQEAQAVRARVVSVPQGQVPNVYRVVPAMGQTEPQTYLGVSTRQLTPDVAAHIGEVPEGVGLIVSYVEEDGPAAKAGLKEHDVLIKMGDQWLINPQQFTVLIRMHEAGDNATLTYVRAGDEQEVEVELAEKELPVFQGAMNITSVVLQGMELNVPAVQAFPRVELAPARREEIDRRIQEAMRQMERQLKDQNIPDLQQHMQGLERSLRGRQLDLERLRRDAARPFDLASGGRLQINNDDISLSMLNDDGQITIEVTDDEGKTLYEGGFPNEEEMRDLPAEVREIVEQARKFLPQADEADKADGADEAGDEDEAEEDEDERARRARTQRVHA